MKDPTGRVLSSHRELTGSIWIQQPTLQGDYSFCFEIYNNINNRVQRTVEMHVTGEEDNVDEEVESGDEKKTLELLVQSTHIIKVKLDREYKDVMRIRNEIVLIRQKNGNFRK